MHFSTSLVLAILTAQGTLAAPTRTSSPERNIPSRTSAFSIDIAALLTRMSSALYISHPQALSLASPSPGPNPPHPKPPKNPHPPKSRPFSGTGQLIVYLNGAATGCVNSAGLWVTDGSCDTFSASATSGPTATCINLYNSAGTQCATDNNDTGALGCEGSAEYTVCTQGNRLLTEGNTILFTPLEDAVPESGQAFELDALARPHEIHVSIGWQAAA